MMAALEVTAVVPPTNPDEDAWLYGDTQPKTNGSTLDANATEFISQAQNGQNSEEDSDSDDDDVQITIRDITKAAPGPYGIPYQPPQISALPPTKTVSVIGQTAPTIVGPIQASTKRTIDVNAVGSINGVPLYDYDIETMCEERPWRIPGADMTDYFNYGFNETSWKSYCDKQRNVRVIAGEGKQHVKIVEQVQIRETLPNPQPTSIYSKHSGGSIDVIGSHKERDTGVPHPIHTPAGPRMIVPGMPSMPSMPTMPGMIPPMMPGMFPPPGQLPAGFPNAFPPGLAPPGLAPPPEMRPEIKREDGTYKIPPSSMPMSMAGPLPPPRGMFPMPGAMVRAPMLPNMLPPPGAAMVPPMLLPPPLFSDSSESGSAGEERRRGEQRGRRSHSREKRSRRTRDHKDRSSDRRDHSRSSGAPRRERDRKDRDKTRRSSRGEDSSRHRHRRDEEGRTKRSRRKKDSKSGGEDEEGRTKRSRRKKDSKSGGEEEEGEGKEVEATNGD